MISDHLPIYACRKQKRNCIVYETVTGRSYKRYDPDLFKALLALENWDVILHQCTTENMWSYVLREICEILSIMCPVKGTVSRIGIQRKICRR